MSKTLSRPRFRYPCRSPAEASGQADGSTATVSVKGDAAREDASGSETQERMYEEGDGSLKRYSEV